MSSQGDSAKVEPRLKDEGLRALCSSPRPPASRGRASPQAPHGAASPVRVPTGDLAPRVPLELHAAAPASPELQAPGLPPCVARCTDGGGRAPGHPPCTPAQGCEALAPQNPSQAPPRRRPGIPGRVEWPVPRDPPGPDPALAQHSRDLWAAGRAAATLPGPGRPRTHLTASGPAADAARRTRPAATTGRRGGAGRGARRGSRRLAAVGPAPPR